jgi:hypothetical protein
MGRQLFRGMDPVAFKEHIKTLPTITVIIIGRQINPGNCSEAFIEIVKEERQSRLLEAARSVITIQQDSGQPYRYIKEGTK